MRASPVRVYARVEADIGAVVRRYDGAGMIPEVYRLGLRFFVFEFVELVEVVEVRLHFDPLEAVLRIIRRAASGYVWISHPEILRVASFSHHVTLLVKNRPKAKLDDFGAV